MSEYDNLIEKFREENVDKEKLLIKLDVIKSWEKMKSYERLEKRYNPQNQQEIKKLKRRAETLGYNKVKVLFERFHKNHTESFLNFLKNNRGL